MNPQQAEWEGIVSHLTSDVQFQQCLRLAEADFCAQPERWRWPENIVRNSLILLAVLVALGLLVLLCPGWVAGMLRGLKDWLIAQSLSS